MNRILFLSLLAIAYGFSPDALISKSQSVPAGADKGMIAECPKINMTYPDPFDEKAPLKFQVQIEDVDPNKKLKYSWFVSKGYVKFGQGTASIIVGAKDSERQGLTATVVISGLPYECENEVSRTTPIARLNNLSNTALNDSLSANSEAFSCEAMLAVAARRAR